MALLEAGEWVEVISLVLGFALTVLPLVVFPFIFGLQGAPWYFVPVYAIALIICMKTAPMIKRMTMTQIDRMLDEFEHGRPKPDPQWPAFVWVGLFWGAGRIASMIL